MSCVDACLASRPRQPNLNSIFLTGCLRLLRSAASAASSVWPSRMSPLVQDPVACEISLAGIQTQGRRIQLTPAKSGRKDKTLEKQFGVVKLHWRSQCLARSQILMMEMMECN